MRTDYFAELKGSVVTHVTQQNEAQVTHPESTHAANDAHFTELLPLLPKLPTEMSTSESLNCGISKENALPVNDITLDDGCPGETAFNAFQSQASGARTTNDLVSILKDFSQGNWTLVERAAMSNTYTPHAHRLIDNENADKYCVLEDLAVLCWAKQSDITSSDYHQIHIAPLEKYFPSTPPDEILEWIIDSVKQAPELDQSNWWKELAKWLNTDDESVQAWRCHVFESLSNKWDEVLACR